MYQIYYSWYPFQKYASFLEIRTILHYFARKDNLQYPSIYSGNELKEPREYGSYMRINVVQ
jgi:hypothetical protein